MPAGPGPFLTQTAVYPGIAAPQEMYKDIECRNDNTQILPQT